MLIILFRQARSQVAVAILCASTSMVYDNLPVALLRSGAYRMSTCAGRATSLLSRLHYSTYASRVSVLLSVAMVSPIPNRNPRAFLSYYCVSHTKIPPSSPENQLHSSPCRTRSRLRTTTSQSTYLLSIGVTPATASNLN